MHELWKAGAKLCVRVCGVTEAQFITLKALLKAAIDMEQDSVRCYRLGNNWKQKVDIIGKDNGVDFTGELII